MQVKDSWKNHGTLEEDYPIPVPSYRFDQKNEVFKRARWDKDLTCYYGPMHSQIKYRDVPGYRQLDYALRNAAWNLEYQVGWGNSKSNDGLYSWSHVTEKIKPFIEAGDVVNFGPDKNSRLVKQAARFLGADLAGIAPVHPNLIYSHEYNLFSHSHYPLELPEGHTRAIMLAIEMDYPTMRWSPNGIAGAATGLGYSRMAFTANSVANFIRGLGWQAAPAGNDTGLSVPLAMAAGLGEAGRMGLLITKAFGPRVRLCKVFTDMPLAVDSYRPFGAAQFCRHCKKCVKHCPAKCVPADGPTYEGKTVSNHSGVLKWYTDPERCYGFWIKNNMDCTNCIQACPFNKPPGLLHDISRVVIRKWPVFNRFFVWADDLLGYSKSLHCREYWGMNKLGKE
jgi:reductive dehalogenase